MNQQGGRILEGSSGIINSFARKEYAVSNDNVFPLKNPAAVASEVGDALAEVLRERARGLLAQAVAAELSAGPRGSVFGPFVPLLRSPEFMTRLQKTGEYRRFRNFANRASSTWSASACFVEPFI